MSEIQAKSLQDLQKDLASYIRVRNRLAQTQDEQLPHVLQGLLPRVLKRLDENSVVLYSAPTKSELTKIRQQMETQLVGILSHALERIRGRRDMPVPWVGSVLQVLNTIDSTVTLTLTLSLLQRALPRYPQPLGTLELIIPCVDALYRQMRTEVTEARKPQFRMIGWIFLDSVAMSFGLPALVDRDIDHYDERSVTWQDLDSKTVAATEGAIQAMLKDGAGVLDLLLDILLFWPPRSRSDADNTTGISIEGLARMNHRGSSWTEIYLRQLKYACTRYAIMPPDQGLLRGDRSILLSVLSASGSSMHGRIAASNLSQYENGTSLIRNNDNQWQGYQACCSLQLASCLLILILGDEAAKSVLEKHEEDRAYWEEILGPRPTAPSMYRSPLPISVAARVIEFIRCHCRPNASDISGANAGVRLFVDLVVAVQDPLRHGVYWGIQLIEGLYKQLRQSEISSGWVDGFYQRCLRTAKAVLSTLPDSMPADISPRREQPLGLPGGVPEPFNRRRDLNHLLSRHRDTQKRKLLRLGGAMHAREIAYEMITELSTEYQLEEDPDGSRFELPIELFKCVGSEEEGLQQAVTRALDAHLISCKRRAEERRRDDERTRRHKVAVLLPSLLCAACAENTAARLAVAKWCNEFLATMDPSAASHICAYLSEDFDPFVSDLAKRTVSSLLSFSFTSDSMETEYQAEFVDMKKPSELNIIRKDLEGKITTLAMEGRMSEGAAFLLLQGHQFSKEEVFKGLLCDREAALEKCGLIARFENTGCIDADEDLGDFTCKVCYEDFDDRSSGYAMPCGHRFCRSCWNDYLSSSFGSERFLVRLTCPHHKCTERVSYDEFTALAPELLQKWNDACLVSFIQDSEHYQPCTGPDCEMVAHLQERTSQTVTCSQCHKSFCFECGNQPHHPAKCRDFEEWNRIFGSSEFWVKKNAKPCPSCKVPIEKNQGCNHVRCTQCGAEFCWLCLSPIRLHFEPHTCNRYDPISAAEGDDERRALFFTERYQAHDEAEMFAKDQVKEIEENLEKLATKSRFVAEEEWEILSNSIKTLVSARYFLKHSYIAAWAIRNDLAKRDVFESHQATLEVVTERLSQMTMMKLDEIFATQGPRGIRMQFRAMNFNMSSISSYMQRIKSLQNTEPEATSSP